MKKIDQAIKEVRDLIEEYSSPMTYQESEYYERCRAKVDVLEDLLHTLERIKKGI